MQFLLKQLTFLNSVRGCSTGVDYVAADFANADAFIEALMLEINIEFLVEGMR